jgi:hypothetical protein
MALESKLTRFGRVYRLVGGCKDDYDNIRTSKRYRKASGVIPFRTRKVAITMQKPALDAFRQAEVRLGREIVVTGSARSCALQAQLYASDRNRYAPPSVGLHCQDLAIDVTTEDPQLKTKVREALEHVGFTQARPDDEPWHFSYGWTA